MSAAIEALKENWRTEAEALPGPSAPRAAAWEQFTSTGIPTQRDEDWRFTPMDLIAKTAWQAASRQASGSPEAILKTSPRIVFINGNFAPAASELDALPAGVRVENLAAVLTREPARATGLLDTLADPKGRAFTALNRALFRDGVWIEIDAGVSLDAPLLIVNYCDATDVAIQLRHCLRIGAGSRVSVVEHSLGAADSRVFGNSVTEVDLARDARLEHLYLQQESRQSARVAELAVRQDAGSHFVSHSLALGAALARFDARVELAGEGAHAELLGLYLGRERQHLDHHTTLDHATPHTTSDELYKGVLAGRARGVFHGRIHVRPHAQKIQALQHNRNLLLSDRATVNTKPQLEIHADDVRCSHGATIGQLDPEHVFYLRSRGLDEDRARALLTFGFAADVLARIEIPGVRQIAEQRLMDWLGKEESA